MRGVLTDGQSVALDVTALNAIEMVEKDVLLLSAREPVDSVQFGQVWVLLPTFLKQMAHV